MKLLEERELCVCELMQVLGMSQPRISRHLGVLKNAGLVEDRRAGKWVHYSLRNDVNDSALQSIIKLLSGLENDHPTVLQDKKKLENAIRVSELAGRCAACSKEEVAPTP